MSWPVLCPACGASLGPLPEVGDLIACRCGVRLERRRGAWDFLLPAEAAGFGRFLEEYGTVRRSEGRGAHESAWYWALPEVPASDPLAWQWRIRARSVRALVTDVLPAVSRPGGLAVLDLGAGNGWLSYRLAQAGHRALAVDVWLDDLDGLGAARHYDAVLPVPFARLRASFDRLPLPAGVADVVLFNASFHYSPDFDRTLAEALRVVAAEGTIVIMDSPIYRSADAGRAMVAERRAAFQARYGFPSDALGSREYLTDDEIQALGWRHGLRWQRVRPWYGLGWWLRPWRARLARRRAPARFELLVGQRVAVGS